MVHRTEMVTVNADGPPEEIVAAALKSEYTRIPLWRNTPENIVGILHAKDLLRAIQNADGDLSKVDIMAIALPPWFVPDIRPLSEQLKAFRRRKTHFALVVDEYGEVEGLVTLEDILEEIVGDISDEHDIPVPGVRPQPDGSVNVDGAVPIRDLNRAMDWNLPDAEATTVAGLVIHEARSIPDVGQTLHLPRLPLQRAAQAAQPDHCAAHHAAGAKARADGPRKLSLRRPPSCRVDLHPVRRLSCRPTKKLPWERRDFPLPNPFDPVRSCSPPRRKRRITLTARSS